MAEGLLSDGQNFEMRVDGQVLDPQILQILHTPGIHESLLFQPEPGLDTAILDDTLRHILDKQPPTFNPSDPPTYTHVPRISRKQFPPEPPADMGSANVTDKLRLASGLPDGPIIPDTVVRLAGNSYDILAGSKPRVVAGSAIIVAGSIISGVMPAAGISAASKEVITRIDKPAVTAPPATPAVAPVVEVPFTYTPTANTTPREIANVMQASSAKIAKQNGIDSPAAVIEPGSTVGGTVRASKITLVAPVGVDQLAQAYGLNRESILAVNTPNEHGLLIGEALIPGRLVVEVPEAQQFDTETAAAALALSEVGAREMKRVNANAPEGQFILPLSNAVEQQIPKAASVALKAATPPLPTIPGVPETTNAPTTTIVSPDTTTSTTVPADPPSSVAPPTTQLSPEQSAPSTTDPPSTVPVPEVVPPSVPPTPELPPAPEAAPPVTTERPATPEEKMNKDIQAVHEALDHALATGDLGPLNHLVTFSPIFKSYNMTKEQQDAGIRHLPPANFFGDWITYEFGRETPDNERQAVSKLIALNLYAAYAFNREVASNPEWAAAYPLACIRFNDSTAAEGHQTHKSGVNTDVNSSLVCNIVSGHDMADGPVGWVNRSSAISHSVNNPKYSFDLDYRMIDRLRRAQIDGVPVLSSILYNAAGMQDMVTAHEDHGDHMHLTATGTRIEGIASFAQGGGRPELNLDNFRAQVLAAYSNGEGVPGQSQNLIITEVVAQPNSSGSNLDAAPPDNTPPQEETATPAEPENLAPEVLITEGQKHAFVRALLLNEIASGEGSYDSVNRGHAGDTQIGSAAYKRVFGERPLSQHTIGELMELQRKGLILAIGKYQFIGGTFESAVKALGMDVNQVFDAATQDYMAANYLIFMKRENLADYIKGDDSKEYLAQEDLCREFASVPCNDGTGHYDGDKAGNAARGGRARVARFRLILKTLQQTYLSANKEVLEELQTQQQAAA